MEIAWCKNLCDTGGALCIEGILSIIAIILAVLILFYLARSWRFKKS